MSTATSSSWSATGGPGRCILHHFCREYIVPSIPGTIYTKNKLPPGPVHCLASTATGAPLRLDRGSTGLQAWGQQYTLVEMEAGATLEDQ
jgi:hypothetical protein